MDRFACVVAVLEGFISQQPLDGILDRGWYERTECRVSQVLRIDRHRLPGVAMLEVCLSYILLFVESLIGLDLCGSGLCSTLLI